VFKELHLIDVWQDGEIRVGSDWDDSIEQAMACARVAVLLLTPHALASKYILNREFPFLRGRQQRDGLLVLPVICETCDWRAHDWLRAIQAPNKAKPISDLLDPERDRVFRDIATTIAEELSRAAVANLPQPERPLPAEQVYLDRFPLTYGQGVRQERLIGRQQELTLLDLAFAEAHTTVVSLVAWGGVGKTMLVKHWLQRIQRGNWPGARRVYAWSFYSQGTKEDRQASEDAFLDHALAWFGVECEATVSPWEKGRLLAEAVRRERALLVLDGIEPLQHPPGPIGGQFRAPGLQSLLRDLARNADQTEQRGLCLVTTREPIVDVATFERQLDSAWGSVLRVDLGNLTVQAGAALLHHAGANRAGGAKINSEHKELMEASREVGNHALTLNLLGRFLARAHRGDIRQRKDIDFEEADRKEQGGTTFKMLAAFEKWFTESGALPVAILRMLGLFDRPADDDTIAALREPPTIPGLTEPFFLPPRGHFFWRSEVRALGDKDMNTAIAYLADFGLVERQDGPTQDRSVRGTYELDCHPLIRQHFSNRLQVQAPQAWSIGNDRIAGHLLSKVSQELPDATNSASRKDFELLFNAASHECAAGKYSHALNELYRTRIARGDIGYATRTYGLFSSEVALLASFFDPKRPWDPSGCRLSSEAERLVALRCAGFGLATLGQFEQGLPLLRLALDGANRRGDTYTAAITARNLANFLIRIGDLPQAEEVLEQNLHHADRTSDKFMPVGYRCSLAYTRLLQEGPVTPVANLFADAWERNARRGPDVAPVELPNFHYCSFLIARGDAAAALSTLDAIEASPTAAQLTGFGRALFTMLRIVASAALEDWDGADALLGSLQGAIWQAGRSDVIGLWHLTRAEVALHRLELRAEDQQLLDRAQGSIEEGIEIADRDRLFLLRADALRLRAWLRFLRGEPGRAQDDLDQAWNMAEPRRMRPNLADIHLLRSRLFLREKAYPWGSPQADLAAAEKLVNDCDYHRRDKELSAVRGLVLSQ
jgi:tetratricopeptide (TPR) repeat protein